MRRVVYKRLLEFRWMLGMQLWPLASYSSYNLPRHKVRTRGGGECLRRTCSCHRLFYFTFWNNLHMARTKQTTCLFWHTFPGCLFTHRPMPQSSLPLPSLPLKARDRDRETERERERERERSHYVYCLKSVFYRKPPRAPDVPSSAPLGVNPAGARPSSLRRRSCHGPWGTKGKHNIRGKQERCEVISHEMSPRHRWARRPDPPTCTTSEIIKPLWIKASAKG